MRILTAVLLLVAVAVLWKLIWRRHNGEGQVVAGCRQVDRQLRVVCGQVAGQAKGELVGGKSIAEMGGREGMPLEGSGGCGWVRWWWRRKAHCVQRKYLRRERAGRV